MNKDAMGKPVRLDWTAVRDSTRRRRYRLVPYTGKEVSASYYEKGGRRCIATRNSTGAPWVYFRLPLDIRFVYGRLNLTVSLFFDDRQDVWIEYDFTDTYVTVDPLLPGAFKPTPTTAMEPTMQWR